MVIAANQDGVFRRLCDAMGRPELADDPRFATHLARGENQEEIEAIVAEWAARHDAREIDRILNEAGVVCGPIYSIAEIFEDPQFQAREMLVEHVDPEFGQYIGPGHRPEVLARRRARCGGRERGRRAATTRRSTAACSASRRRSSTRCARMASYEGHDLRRRPAGRPAEPARHARARRAGGAGRSSRSGRCAAGRGGQLRQPKARAADGRRGGGRRGDPPARRGGLRRPRTQRARLRPAPRERARRGALRLRGLARSSTAATQARPSRREWPPRSGSSSARRRTGYARP